MKLISWNIGNFIWLKYFPGRKHYFFQIEDLDFVYKQISKENADVIFLQEIHHADFKQIEDHFTEYNYKLRVDVEDRDHFALFLSKYPITELHHTYSNDYIINGITFFPIHLNAFSPKKRQEQVNILLNDLPHKKGIILGDTNFWILYNYFLSKKDKETYKKIVSNHEDILKDLGPTSRAFLSLDKIFITEDLSSINEKIVKHSMGHIDHYMISAEISHK